MTRKLVDDCFRPNQPRLRHDDALAQLRAAVAPTVVAPMSVAPTSAAPTFKAVDVALNDAGGRALAESVLAVAPVPAHTNAAVDGYAFKWTPQIREMGASLVVAERVAAGHPLNRPVDTTTAVRIFTGAVIPDGLDTVVMQEDVEREESEGRTAVAIPTGLKAGANVRKAGEDVGAGATLFSQGHILRPQDLAALASVGRSHVACYERVKVAIVSTGDEIREPGTVPLAPGEVYDANTAMLSALAAGTGAQVHRLGIWPDTRETVRARLIEAAAKYDVILTSGGASMGEEDHMAAVLGEIGQRHLWQLAVKPGRPMMFGQVRTGNKDTIVVGLPGNPVAVFVCFLMYVYPLLRAAGGAPWVEPRRFMLPAAFSFSGRKQGRREFWRGRMQQTAQGLAVEKFARDGSGLISGLCWSDGLIDIPEECGDIKQGDPIAFIPFSEFAIP